MRFDKKPPTKPDKKAPPKTQKKGSIGYNKKSALLEDAITQMNAGKYGRASSALKDLLALDPLNAEARRLFATLHLRLGSLMSARTAFESLAREAMERQDYWLAESLLREYLTAGPRYVPFLEMLGRVYEDKGDVMAAVAEYGKAVEVLLEDPDAEKPNHPSELFARIRSLAPGSPVAFRFAAMFDTVTGQVLQAAPQPAAADVVSEPVAAEAVPDVPAENIGLMPWEQVDAVPAIPTSTEVSSAAVVESSPEAVEVVVPPAAPVEALSVAGSVEALPEPPAPVSPQAMVSDIKVDSEPVIEHPPVPEAEPVELVVHDVSSATDSSPAPTEELALPAPPTADVPQVAIELQTETSPHPIAQAPAVPAAMPWDQIEEHAIAIPPASSTAEVEVAEDATAGVTSESTESVMEPPSTVDPVPPVPEVMAQSGSHPIVDVPKGPAPMPWDQVEEAAILIPPPTDHATSAAADSSAVPLAEHESVSSPTETVPPTIEVVTEASSHPIAQAPTSPAPMPWDQVQECADSTPATADLSQDHPIVETVLPGEPATAPSIVDSVATEEPAAGQARSEVTSSGLTWDEILAAVAAMQTPAGPAPTPSEEPAALVSDQTPAEPSTPVVTDAAEEVGLAPVSGEEPAAPPIDSGMAAPSLSAPMPWEQVEVANVTIPPQEPEPEFGPVTAETTVVEQKDGQVVSVSSEPSAPAATGDSSEQDSVVAPAVDAHAASAPGFRIVSGDAPVEPEPESALLPVEAAQLVHEPVRDLLPASEPSHASMVEEPTEATFRFAEPDTRTPSVADTPRPTDIEPVAEFSLAETQQALLEIAPPDTVAPVALPVEATVVQEVVDLAPGDMVPEAAVSSVSPEPVVEPIDVQVEEPTVEPLAAVEPDIPPVPEVASVPEHKSVAQPVAEISLQAPTHDVVSEPEERVPEPTDSIAEPLADSPIQGVAAVPVEEPMSTPISVEPVDVLESVVADSVADVPVEPVAVSAEEAPTPAVPLPTEPVADASLKILWEDASSAPTPAASSGNMLTRWFKKSAEPVSADTGTGAEVAPPTDEPAALEAPVLLQEDLPAAPMTPIEEPVLEPVAQVAPAPIPAPPQQPVFNRPAGKSVWSRAGEAVASLVGAGVSTTRSLIVMAMALVGLALFLVGGTVAVVAVTWLVLEEQPSAAYRNMTSVPQQMLQDSSKNGYFLLLGLGASSTQDPVQVGMDRRAEGSDEAFAHTCLTGEGAASAGDQRASAEAAGTWIKASDPALQMFQNAGGVKALVSQQETALGRYRQWLSKPFEDEGYGKTISPNCGLILQTHRLYVADGFAQDVETGVARLETDLTAWRTVLGQAKTMPVKLLASAAMNDDIAVMGGLLQRPDLDERQIGRLAKLARPLEPAEQSLRWPMQSQFVLATKTVDEAISRDRAASRPFYGAIVTALPLPKQRRFNAYAEYYDVAGKAAAEGRYADLPKQSQFVHAPPYGVSDAVLNPIESLVGVEPLPTWEAYAGRVLETDARLRLASLQAWLRRTPSEQDLLTRLAKAGQGLYDPFTGLPMLVNLKKGVLYSVGPDLKDNEAHERLDLVAQIPSVAWTGSKKVTGQGAAK